MKRSRRNFLADLLFLGGGLTASALLVNSGGFDQSTTRARRETVASTAPETSTELLDWNTNCFERNGEHPAGLGPGHCPAVRREDSPFDFEEFEPVVIGKLRW